MADSGVALARVTADYSSWKARDYFETYYSKVVLPDEQAVLTYQVDVLSALPRPATLALEYGCGPTLHRAIALAPYAETIDMADWLPDNLASVREWLDAGPANGDWHRFTRFVMERERHSAIDVAGVVAREALTRSRVRHLLVSDARWSQPLGPTLTAQYDALVSGFCLDAVSDDKAVWRRCMDNVLGLVAPGGTVILHFLHRCRAYRCGERMFPGADLSIDDVALCLTALGFDPRTIDVQVIPCPDNAEYGYTGILTASARRR